MRRTCCRAAHRRSPQPSSRGPCALAATHSDSGSELRLLNNRQLLWHSCELLNVAPLTHTPLNYI